MIPALKLKLSVLALLFLASCAAKGGDPQEPSAKEIGKEPAAVPKELPSSRSEADLDASVARLQESLKEVSSALGDTIKSSTNYVDERLEKELKPEVKTQIKSLKKKLQEIGKELDDTVERIGTKIKEE